MSPSRVVWVATGLPAPTSPVVTDLSRSNHQTTALAWASGSYALDSKPAAQAVVPAPNVLAGPWHVAFQPGRGAPAAIDLPSLQSLHLQSDPGVKYFSGIATYTHPFEVPASWLVPNRRIVVDLGRVEVIAEVWINSHPIATLWKEPYRLDITESLEIGTNQLEVRVATLWPNRLIGDEQLPAENNYGIRDEQGNDPHGILQLPAWYREGQPKPPGGRIAFTTWKFYEKDEPLVAAGLLGPVRLLNPLRITLP